MAFVNFLSNFTNSLFRHFVCFEKFHSPVSELLHLARCVKFNPYFIPGILLIVFCGTQSNRKTNFIPRLAGFNPRLALIVFSGTRASNTFTTIHLPLYKHALSTRLMCSGHLLRFVLYCARGKTQGNCDCKDGYFWQQFLVTSSLQTYRYFRRWFPSFLGREKRLLEIRLLLQAKSPCTFFCMHPHPYSRRTVALIKQHRKPLIEVLFIVFRFYNTSM